MFIVKKELPFKIEKTSNKIGDYKIDDYKMEDSILTSYINYDDIPEEHRNNLILNFITPIQKNINIAFQQLKTLGSPDALDIINKKIINIKDNLKNINANIGKIQTSEATALFSDIEIKSFSVDITINQGLQLNLIPGTEKYDMFFNIVRKYIFNYKDEKWPPSEDKIKYFMYNDTEKQLCCFYWPLYGFIKYLFDTDFNGKTDLNDLFVLSNMQKYCKDFFIRAPKNTSQPGQQGKKGKKGQIMPQILWQSTGGDPQNDLKKPKPNDDKKTGEYKKPNDDKKLGEYKKPNDDKKLGEYKKEKDENEKKENERHKPVSDAAMNCNYLKLNKVERILKESKINIKVGNKYTGSNEYAELNKIVTKYIKDLKETDLIVGGKTIQEFIQNNNKNKSFNFTITDSNHLINNNCKNMVINESELVFIDPLIGSTATYKNLTDWFGYKKEHIKKDQTVTQIPGMQKKQKEVLEYKDPCNVIKNSYNMYISNYTLPSPMWKLQPDELKGIRTRFMKLLSFLLLQFKKMYESILIKYDVSYVAQNKSKLALKNKNSKTPINENSKIPINENSKDNNTHSKDNNTNSNKNIYTPNNLEEIQKFYSNLLKSIAIESDPDKKEQLNIVKKEFEETYSNILK